MKEILCGYRVAGKLPKGEYLIKGKGLHAALLILIREKPLSTINALPLSLLTLAEWEETYWNWYNTISS